MTVMSFTSIEKNTLKIRMRHNESYKEKAMNMNYE